MSRRRNTDGVAEHIYGAHLHGAAARFNNNPANNRKNLIQRMYMRLLTELATNRFKWNGLPDSVDVRYMELNLFYHALSVFYWDEEYLRFMALQGGQAGNVNMMQNPTHFYVVGLGEFQSKRLSAVNTVMETVTIRNGLPDRDFITMPPQCVPIWSNYLRVPDLDIVMIYASKLAEIDRTIEINLQSARRNKVLTVSENTQLSLTNLNRQLDEGQGAVQVAQGVMDMVQALDLGVHPDTIEKLSIVKSRLWSECMTYLGINNANQDKKERLVASEVQANDDQVESTKAINLNSRRAAAKRINNLYGLNITVEYNVDAEAQANSVVNDARPVTEDE